MAIRIEEAEVERLLAEVVRLTGESETEAVRNALAERLERLAPTTRERRLRAFLEDDVWPNIPPEQLGVRLTKAEEARLLGYDEEEG